MHTRPWTVITVSLALVVPLGCGSDEDGAGAATIPTAEQLGASLLTPDDLDGTWAVHAGPGDAPMPTSGVLTDESRTMLPSIELCPAASAESRAAAESLEWLAFRQLDMTPDDPIAPPDDRIGHMVFVQQFLLAGEPSAVQATFELLRDGMKACLGEIDTGEEGPGTATEISIPEVGDDRYGVLATVQEAGGEGEWLLHNTLVLQGAVLMMIDVVDIHIGVAPLLTADDVGTIVTTATDRLSAPTAHAAVVG
jgi:hypothetical protein